MFSKVSNLSLYYIRKRKTSLIWKTRYRRGKRNQMWDSRAVVRHIWGTFVFVAFNVILGVIGAIAIFLRKFFKCSSSTLIFFSSQIFVVVPYDSQHKSYFFVFKH